MISSRQKIKVNILSGYLGSGKTSAILSYINKTPEEEIAILVNEFGEIGIDGKTLASSNSAIFEVSGGCFCCSSKIIFRQKLIEIARKKNIHRLFIVLSVTDMSTAEHV